jgi:lipoprotein-anchoring transpeptidase ErfK/SrfK
MLAERFHAAPRLLQALNANASFAAGTSVVVPDVEPFYPPTGSGKRKSETPANRATQTGAASKETNAQSRGRSKAAGSGEQRAATQAEGAGVTITVIKGSNVLTVTDASGATVFHAPVTVGSEHDPLPVGSWKVTGVFLNPPFHYNPDLFWDADPTHAKAKIAPGPNNPVGAVWLGISQEHYGFHGTPEPSLVGHTQSHGCIRLTNWDAVRLAALVSEGTEVVFHETTP